MTPPSPERMPTLPALLGTGLPSVLADCRPHTGPILAITRLTGGNVSHVFRVGGQDGSVIVKIRGSRFARIPALRTNPALIADERRALKLYGATVPHVFPQVLAFHPTAHAMVLSDVFLDQRNYHEHLHQRPATIAEMTRLGGAARSIHHATREARLPRRSPSDERFPPYAVDFCLRSQGHAALDAACEQMTARPDRQLILGDLAPKNLSLAAGTVAVCDLDNVHRGWPLYDVGYFLAHLLIHHLQRPHHLPVLVPALLQGYLGTQTLQPGEERLMATVTAGVIVYRLADSPVPYPLVQPPAVVERCRERVLCLLDSGTVTVDDLVRATGAREAAA
ncbi:phosphotransferase [Streptomyces sp. NPDC059003]|uniref:phosphotransferase n=1 Tax=Streptomyces sp. NPDC059003 TaxID=3346691 RepID=UPI0036C2A977